MLLVERCMEKKEDFICCSQISKIMITSNFYFNYFKNIYIFTLKKLVYINEIFLLRKEKEKCNSLFYAFSCARTCDENEKRVKNNDSTRAQRRCNWPPGVRFAFLRSTSSHVVEKECSPDIMKISPTTRKVV